MTTIRDLHLEFAVPNSPVLLLFTVLRELRVLWEEDVSGTSWMSSMTTSQASLGRDIVEQR